MNKQSSESTPSTGSGPSAGNGAKKGWTKDNKPRQRAYRTYFAVGENGVVHKYPSFEAREVAVKKSGVERVSARDAERIEREGAPVVGTHRSPSQAAPKPSLGVPKPVATLDREVQLSREVQLLRAQALLNHCVTLIGEIQTALADAGPNRS